MSLKPSTVRRSMWLGVTLTILWALFVVSAVILGVAQAAHGTEPYEQEVCLETEQLIDGYCVPNEVIEPEPEPTVGPEPEPTEEPTPEPTIEPTPEPTVEPTPEPTVAPEPPTGTTAPPAPEKVVSDDVQPVGTLATTAGDPSIILWAGRLTVTLFVLAALTFMLGRKARA